MTTTTADPSLFHGFPVDLVQGLQGFGRAVIDNDALYEAVQAYQETVASVGGAVLGPALLTTDATQPVRGLHWHRIPSDLKPAPAPSAKAEATFETMELDDLMALAAKHNVVLGRVKTPGKVIAALEAAGVTP